MCNLRNDDIYNFRLGNPQYARAYYANMPLNVTATYGEVSHTSKS